MTCDSAACFGIAGLGLLFASRNSFRRARALGILLLVLGSSYLSASLTNTWLSFHYFFPHYTAAVVAPLPLHSCRVATFTATVFLLLGGFLILLSPTSFKRSPLALAAFLACAIPTLGVLGGIFLIFPVSSTPAIGRAISSACRCPPRSAPASRAPPLAP